MKFLKINSFFKCFTKIRINKFNILNRLNTPSDDQGTGGWIAAIDDYKPVVLIDFFEERNLTGIITQGEFPLRLISNDFDCETTEWRILLNLRIR